MLTEPLNGSEQRDPTKEFPSLCAVDTAHFLIQSNEGDGQSMVCSLDACNTGYAPALSQTSRLISTTPQAHASSGDGSSTSKQQAV